MTPNTARKINPFDTQHNEEQEVALVVQQAKALSVTNQDELADGREFYVTAKALLQKIEDHHAPIINAAHNTHKVAIAKKKELTEPIEKAMKIVRAACETYMQEQERTRIEDNRRREAEARKELEAKVTAFKAKCADMTACVKEDAGKIAALKAALDDASDLEAQVIRAEISVLETASEGRAQAAVEAQAQLEMDTMIPDPVAVAESNKVEGVGQVKDYIVEVTDMKALCAGIGRGDVPVAAVKEVASKLKSYAKDGIKLPGCKVTAKVTARFSA